MDITAPLTGRLTFAVMRWFDIRHGASGVAAIAFAPDCRPAHQCYRGAEQKQRQGSAHYQDSSANQGAPTVDAIPVNPAVPGDIQGELRVVPMHRSVPQRRSAMANPLDAGA
ncbi:hypothetical protein [Stenotrophomonas nematodicola]|uniref:hypothetical protein n=1 Tax=Stenotrophomonas nematodicola TaxID=2656746 RepID=UPI00129239DC|nr:hypothetical protein [Stenotrophomonas nematodicola]